MVCQRWLRLEHIPPGQHPLRQQPHAQHRLSTCTRLSAVLVLEEDVDGGGRASVNMGVTATGYVFHELNVAGSKHVPGAITGANLDFAGKMNDQPAFGKRVEVPLSGTVKLLHPDLVYSGQCAQFRVLLHTRFLHMAFTVAARKNSIYSHSAPPPPVTHRKHTDLCDKVPRQTGGHLP